MTVWHAYFFSLHVSGNYVAIIRRNNCIYATLSTYYSVRMTVWYANFFSLHVSGDYVPIIRRSYCLEAEWNSTLHTRQSCIQNKKYQVSCKYSCFSWWWAHSRPKYVEKRNKHTKKNCARSCLYLQDQGLVISKCWLLCLPWIHLACHTMLDSEDTRLRKTNYIAANKTTKIVKWAILCSNKDYNVVYVFTAIPWFTPIYFTAPW